MPAEGALYTHSQNDNGEPQPLRGATREGDADGHSNAALGAAPLPRPGAAGTRSLLFDVMNDGEAPKPSLDEAFKRAVFATYPTLAS